MTEYIVKGPIGMPRGTSLCIDDGAGVLISVREGDIWLTQEGCPKDLMLRAGDSFRLERNGATIAHSFRRSAVTLASRGPVCPARRISVTRAGSVDAEVLHQRSRWTPGEALRGLLTRLHALIARSIATAG